VSEMKNTTALMIGFVAFTGLGFSLGRVTAPKPAALSCEHVAAGPEAGLNYYLDHPEELPHFTPEETREISRILSEDAARR
jgi:hypothetical protein